MSEANAPDPESLIIPYGVPAFRAGQVTARALRDGGAGDMPAPFVAVDRSAGRMLRLNGDQYAFPEPPDLRTMTAAGAQLDFLREHLKHFCDLWAKPPLLFVDRYFDFVSARVEAEKDALMESLARFGGLYDYRDWALSAPRPLPRALLATADGAWCPADFVFWLGGRPLAVMLAGSGTPTRQDSERRQALADAGAEIAELSVAALTRSGADYLASGVLPAEFDRFWEGEVMPSSPFKGTSLAEIVRE